MADSTPLGSSSVRTFILERRRLQMTLYTFKDLAGIASKIYSSEAKIFYPERNPSSESGPEAVLRWYRQSGGIDLVISVQDVGDDMDSDKLFEWSHVKLLGGEGRVVKEGTLVAIWKKCVDNFLVEVESFTHNA